MRGRGGGGRRAILENGEGRDNHDGERYRETEGIAGWRSPDRADSEIASIPRSARLAIPISRGLVALPTLLAVHGRFFFFVGAPLVRPSVSSARQGKLGWTVRLQFRPGSPCEQKRRRLDLHRNRGRV